tara:strand:- start:533 stop:1156 length:624 start_codon:yes stop_codon:yes gene_type:complete
MFFSTSFVMCMYILLNYIFLYTVPIADMVGQVDVGYISGVVIFGNTGAMVIGIGISILLLSTVSSYVYIGPRIMQIMGEDHKLLSFLKIKDNKNIPRNAFWLQLLLSFLFMATSSFEQVLMYAGISLIITTTMTVISLFILRYQEPLLDRPYRVKGYPFTPLIYLIVNVWILYYSFQENQFESFIGIGIVTSSVLIHYIFTKRNILL